MLTQIIPDSELESGRTKNPYFLDAIIEDETIFEDIVIISDLTAPRNSLARTAIVTPTDNELDIRISGENNLDSIQD